MATAGFQSVSARHEAAALYTLLKSGERVEDVRRLIHPGPGRDCDDISVYRYRVEVLTEFNRLVCGESRRGRGRRFTEYEKARIRAAVQAGRRSADIEREFGVDAKTVTKIRREIGDTEDRRHWQTVSKEQIVHAQELLASGMRWRDAARQAGMAIATLQRRITYRKKRRG